MSDESDVHDAIEEAAREFIRDWPNESYHKNDMTLPFEKGALWAIDFNQKRLAEMAGFDFHAMDAELIKYLGNFPDGRSLDSHKFICRWQHSQTAASYEAKLAEQEETICQLKIAVDKASDIIKERDEALAKVAELEAKLESYNKALGEDEWKIVDLTKIKE